MSEIIKVTTLQDGLWQLYQEVTSGAEYFGSRWNLEQFEEELSNSFCLVFRGDEGKVLGLLMVRDQFEAEVMWLGVRESARGQGIMKKMLENSYIQLNLQFDKLLLEVHEKNEKALKFYQKCGFVEQGRRLKYYSDGGTAVLMSRSLDLN